jgi:pseudouridine-5'-phosphate glycosidase
LTWQPQRAQWTRVTEEVAAAMGEHRPVVALETTLVSHGFSEGRGLAAAVQSERRVREAGATPATVGILDGAVHVGLTKAELERFAEAGTSARKVGARDLAACLAQGALGATTVGGTLAVCRQLGIRFMGTGGIGGVHRGFAESLDISGDLLQIARTPAVVVASGPKSLLDVGATAELLETLAVPVLGWRTGTLPRFYTAEGGPPVSAMVSDSPEMARICAAHWRFDGAGGLLLARPPASGIDLDPLIDEAVSRVRGQNLAGQAVTPAVLSLVHELSGGRSVEVNRQLIADNAALAAETAVAYAQLKNA